MCVYIYTQYLNIYIYIIYIYTCKYICIFINKYLFIYIEVHEYLPHSTIPTCESYHSLNWLPVTSYALLWCLEEQRPRCTSIHHLIPGPSHYQHHSRGWRMRPPGEKEEVSQEESHFWTWAAGISRSPRQTLLAPLAIRPGSKILPNPSCTARPTDFSLHKPKNVEQLGRNMDSESDDLWLL